LAQDAAVNRLLLFAWLSTTAAPLAAQRHIGELRVLGMAGRATMVTITGSGQYDTPIILPAGNLAGGSASLTFVYGSLSAGPEIFKLWGSKRRVTSLGGVIRLTTTSGRFRPHVVLAGGQDSDSGRFSGSLGGGLTLGDPSGTLGFTGEARTHSSLEGKDYERGRDAYTVMMGVRVAW
jgi:hypothetical protein